MNKGLETLAALASADLFSGGTASNGNGQIDIQRNNAMAASNPPVPLVDRTGNRIPGSSGGSAVVRLPPIAPAPQQAVGSAFAPANQQQLWQQALVGLNPAALSPQNMALLGALRQPPQATDNSALLAMQQQMNYLNYLVQAQQTAKQNGPPASTQVQPVSVPQIGGLGAFSDANQALQLALSGHTGARLLHNRGTLLIVDAAVLCFFSLVSCDFLNMVCSLMTFDVSVLQFLMDVFFDCVNPPLSCSLTRHIACLIFRTWKPTIFENSSTSPSHCSRNPCRYEKPPASRFDDDDRACTKYVFGILCDHASPTVYSRTTDCG
jgi:hypothetical protein